MDSERYSKVKKSKAVSLKEMTDKPKKKSKRCVVCKSKNWTNLICKCGQVVCMSHRYANAHSCKYDHASDDIKKLEKNLAFKPTSKLEVV